MKKLTVLIAVMLIAGLLSGCWLFPEQPLLDYIVADPSPIILTVGDTQQLTVIAYYEDETYADVTSDCDYWARYPEIVTVDREGLVTAIGVTEERRCINVYYYQKNDFTNQRERVVYINATITE